MPQQVGGDVEGTTETEYAGRVPNPNTVRKLDDPKLLKNSERLRLGYLTGQEEDPDAPRKPSFFYGVDPEYPERTNLLERPTQP